MVTTIPPKKQDKSDFADKLDFVLTHLFLCAGPESFVRVGPTLTTFFLVDEGREDPSTTKGGPSSVH